MTEITELLIGKLGELSVEIVFSDFESELLSSRLSELSDFFEILISLLTSVLLFSSSFGLTGFSGIAITVRFLTGLSDIDDIKVLIFVVFTFFESSIFGGEFP